MNRPVIYLGLFFLVAAFLLPASHAADDKGKCENKAEEKECKDRTSHCILIDGKRDGWMEDNCSKACFFCNPEDCADAFEDCATRAEGHCKEPRSQGECMKTCGTCPKS